MLSEKEMWLLCVVGLMAVLGLLKTIYTLLQKKPGSITETRPVQGKQLNEHLMDAKSSIRILASSFLDKQVEPSEVCIRIKVLIDAWKPSLHEDPRFGVFNEVYEKLDHMPTHQKRKEMDKRFRYKLDKQRYEVEKAYESKIREAAAAIITLLDEEPEGAYYSAS